MNELIGILQQSPAAFMAAVFLISLCVGSFLNVVIYRYPITLFNDWRQECIEFMELPEDSIKQSENIGIVFPRSHCPQCKASIPFWRNIPLLSFILLKGKCADCDSKISWRYPFVELFTALLCVFIAWKYGMEWKTLYLLIFTWTMIVIAGIDIDHQLIPDIMSLTLLWFGLLLNSFNVFCSLHHAVYGAAIGYLSLWSFMHFFKLITGKIGMGHGDFKLFAVFGAWIGWSMLPFIIVLASIIGTLIGGLILLLNKSDRDTPIPFGPYLAVAGWVSLIWYQPILATYFELFKLK